MDAATIGLVAVAFTEILKQIPFITKYKLSPIVCIIIAMVINCFMALSIDPVVITAGFVIGLTATGIIKTLTYVASKK